MFGLLSFLSYNLSLTPFNGYFPFPAGSSKLFSNYGCLFFLLILFLRCYTTKPPHIQLVFSDLNDCVYLILSLLKCGLRQLKQKLQLWQTNNLFPCINVPA
jgi:hypothetical protein